MKIIEKSPLISIIIPIYNPGVELLKKCLDSVLSQTYVKFECIAINDGSTDDTPLILDNYAKLDNRIKVIHKNNGGPSETRNKGLKIARGEWVVIIDSDDWIEPDYIENFLFADVGSDLVIQSISDYQKDLPTCNITYHFPEKLWIHDEIATLFSDKKMMKYGTPWSRIYKLEIIKEHNLLFNTNFSLKEDVLFAHQYLSKCNKISTVSYFGYHYIYHQTSLSNTVSKHMTFKKIRDVAVYIYISCMNNIFFRNNKKTKKIISEILLDALWSSIRIACLNRDLNNKEKILFIKETKNIIRKYNLYKYMLTTQNSILLLPAHLVYLVNKLKR